MQSDAMSPRVLPASASGLPTCVSPTPTTARFSRKYNKIKAMPGRSVRVVAVRRIRMNPRTVRPKNKTAIIFAGEPLLLSGPATTTEAW